MTFSIHHWRFVQGDPPIHGSSLATSCDAYSMVVTSYPATKIVRERLPLDRQSTSVSFRLRHMMSKFGVPLRLRLLLQMLEISIRKIHHDVVSALCPTSAIQPNHDDCFAGVPKQFDSRDGRRPLVQLPPDRPSCGLDSKCCCSSSYY